MDIIAEFVTGLNLMKRLAEKVIVYMFVKFAHGCLKLRENLSSKRMKFLTF